MTPEDAKNIIQAIHDLMTLTFFMGVINISAIILFRK